MSLVMQSVAASAGPEANGHEESHDATKVAATVQDAYDASKAYPSGVFDEGVFVETKEFDEEIRRGLALITAAEHDKERPLTHTKLSPLLLGMLGVPRTGKRTIAHLLWARGAKIGNIILPDYLPDNFTPLSTLLFQCCGDRDSYEEFFQAMILEIMYRIKATDRILLIVNLIVAEEEFSHTEFTPDIERLLAAFWTEVMKTDEIKQLIKNIAEADKDRSVSTIPYFAEFPDNCLVFFRELVRGQSQMATCLESVFGVRGEVDEDGDDDDEQDSSTASSTSDKGVVDAGIEDSKASAQDEDFAPSASEADDDNKPTEDDEAESERPKKKKRTKKPVPERVPGSRRSSRLMELASVNMAESEEDNADDDGDDSDEEDENEDQEKEEDEKEQQKPVSSTGVDESVAVEAHQIDEVRDTEIVVQ